MKDDHDDDECTTGQQPFKCALQPFYERKKDVVVNHQ